MHGMNPEHLDPEPSDRSLPADVLLRQEPDEGRKTMATATEMMAMPMKARATRTEKRTCPTFKL
jgi:hypothetical protein